MFHGLDSPVKPRNDGSKPPSILIVRLNAVSYSGGRFPIPQIRKLFPQVIARYSRCDGITDVRQIAQPIRSLGNRNRGRYPGRLCFYALPFTDRSVNGTLHGTFFLY